MRTFPPWAEASAAARRTAVRTQGQRPQVRPLCSAGRGRRGRRSWLPASRLAHLTAPAATQAPSPALLPIAGPHAAVTATVPSSHLSEPRVVGCPGGSEVSAWPGQGPQRRGRPARKSRAAGWGRGGPGQPRLPSPPPLCPQDRAVRWAAEGWQDPPHGSRRHPAHAAVRARRSFPPRSARRRVPRTGGTGQPPAGSIIRTCDGLMGGGAAARGGDGGRGGVTVARRTDRGWRSGTCPQVFEAGEARGCPFLDLAVALSFLARLLLIFL